jgi:autotransporter-associated beta strand protein
MSRASFLRFAVVFLLLLAAVFWWGADAGKRRSDTADAAPVASLPSQQPAAVLSGATARPVSQPPRVVPEESDAKDVVRALRQDVRWEAVMPEPAFAGFRAWAKEFAKAKTDDEKAALMAQGLELAQQRRNELADLIDKDPKRALELAVPVAVRRTLPADVAALLEEPVRGRGDLFVVAAVAVEGQKLGMRPVQRSVTMKDGREFEAFTYGLREQVPTRQNIAIQGIAVDGKLALTELPGRILEPVEVTDLNAKNEVCPTSGVVTSTTNEEVVVDWDGTEPTFFCGPRHALDELMVAAAGDVSASSGGTAQSASTEGTKKLLIIRVDFPDFAGEVVSDATLTTLISNMSTHWQEMSFGKTTWTLKGAGSDITPTLRLPNGHASYTSFGTMLTAARAAALAAGYDYTQYTHEVVVTGSKPSVSFGGIAFVGARGAWLANSQWNLGVCSHEVGHNFGMLHSGFWDTDDGTVIGSGSAVEYGNPFDHMGGASSSMDAHFGARQKNFLDWIVDADVVKITADGTTTTRIRAFDRSVAAGDKAIAVDRPGTTDDYWIEYRQDYADTNQWMRDGVILNWGDLTINNDKPVLLDNTPGGSKDDCPVLIGRTFSDTAAGIHITPVLRGSDPDGTTWIDVTVNRGAFAGNRKPSVTMAASNLNPAINGSVTFTATATDPDGDTLGYHWDWGDGTFTANNSSTASKSWSSTGVRTVRCYVTDMKGLTTTGQVLVQVGTSTTFFIQGTVRTTAGALVEGVVVKADATHTDTTDSEGYYAITGLNAGSYTMTATKTGLSILPDAAYFTNPVTVGPSKLNMDFTAPPGSPYFATMKAGLLDQGSNTGAVILPVLDADTPITSLTLTGTSSNTAVIPDASITFGTVGTTVRTVTAAAASSTVSGPVNITITATDPEGGTNSYVWPVTVNAKPVNTVTTKTTPENTPIDIDLRTFVADDLTIDDQIGFELQRARDGVVTLLPDGHTARFTPAPNYNGAASFRMITRDQSLGPRLLFLYDFEPPDVFTDAKSTDQSNFNRTGTLETGGVGGEYAYTPDVPPVMAPWSTQSLSMTEAGTGGARLRRTLTATDIDYNDADWSFSTWVNRATNDTEDFVMHLGSGDGHGTEAELELFFSAGSNTLRLQKWGSTLEKEIVGPNLNIGEWHHITLTYDRTATDTGTFALYVDGFAYGSVTAVAMNVSQTASLKIGGHNSTTASLDRWFNGQIEDAQFQSGINSRAEIWGLAHFSSKHYNGLTATSTVNITVTGTNQPPAITAVPDVYLPVSGVSGPVAFTLSDAETEARNVTVTAASSNTALLPVSGITFSAAPVWTSSDIGAVGAPGSLTEDHGTFIIGGAGADIGPAAGDEFRWVRQDFSGDAEIIARVASIDHSNADSKAGVMMRDSTTATSPYALACVTPSGGVSFQYRATESTLAVVKATINAVAAPCWLRLVRSGSNFTAFYAIDTDGLAGPWLPIGTAQAITFPAATNQIGLAVTSKVDASVCTAVFGNLGGTVKLGGERTVTVTPTAAMSGTAVVTLTANDGAATTTDTFNVVVDGAPPSTTVWSATTTGSTLNWSSGANWTGGVPPPSSRFSTAEFFTGQTFTAGTITSNNDTSLGHALNVLTLGGTGPTTGTSTISITGNPILLRRETSLLPAINLTATNGTGLTYNVSAPITLDDDTTAQGTGTATFILSGGVGGAGALVKTGSSRLILAGDSTYAGTTTISAGTLQIGNDGATGTLAPSDVTNNSALRFDRTGTLLVPANITGTGTLTIDCPINEGTVVLSGSNSFTGAVTVSSGALRITNSNALGTTATNKTITLSAGTAGNCQLLLDGSGGDIDITAGIRYTTSNPNGTIFNEAGNNILRGNITCAAGGGNTKITVVAGTLTLEGTVSPNTTGRTFVLGGAGTGFCNGVISSGIATRSLAVTKADAGTWTLSGANTYSGTTTVSAGTLLLGNASALGNGGSTIGNANGGTTVTAGATLDLNGQQGINERITVNGNGVGGVGGLVNNSATGASIAGGVVSSISTTAGGTHSTVPVVTITGTGSGATATATLGVTAASFTINGGTTVYSAAPTVAISGGGGSGAAATAVLSGGTSGTVTGITITTANAGTGFTSAPTITFSGGTVTTAGTNPTGTGNATNFIVSAITVTNPGSGYTSPPTVSFGSGTGTTATANLSTVILGAATTIGGSGDITIDSGVSGNFALTKAGAGTLTLNGTSSNASSTTINAGTLRGEGSFAGNLVINGGAHAPGNSPGIATTSGSYTLAAAATLQIEINGTSPGTQHDQVSVGGTVTLAGALDLAAAPALAANSTFTIINNTGAGAVSGTFASKPQNAEFYEDGQWWRISYTGGTGNDVVLTRITPTAWQTWQSTNFGNNANNMAIAGDLADTDNDGTTNLMEYATGSNPAAGQPAPQSATNDGADLHFTYTKNKSATDVTYTVEWADNLTGPWSSSSVTSVILSDNGTTQQIKATMPAGTNGRRFVRLRVNR